MGFYSGGPENSGIDVFELPSITGLGSSMRWGTPGGHNGQNVALTANRLYMMPMHFRKTRTLGTIGIMVQTAGAVSTVARLGLYQNDNGEPGAFIADYGTVVTDATGLQELSIAQAVSGSLWYWVGLVLSGTPTTWTLSNSAAHPAGYDTSTTNASNASIAHLYRAFAFGTLPTSDQAVETWTKNWLQQTPLILWS